MTGAELKRIAVLLFGEAGWSEGLSSSLRVNPRTILRAAKDETPIPDGWRSELSEIMARRIVALKSAIRGLAE